MSEDSDTFEEGMTPSPKYVAKEPEGEPKKKLKPKKKSLGNSAGQARCVHCAAVLKLGMRFCNKCGKPQDEKKPETPKAASVPLPVTKTVVDEEEEIVEEIIEEIVEEEEPSLKSPSPPSLSPYETSDALPFAKAVGGRGVSGEDDAVFKKPGAPVRHMSVRPVQVMDEDGDEEEDESDTKITPREGTPKQKRLAHLAEPAKKFENSPRRVAAVDDDSDDDDRSRSPAPKNNPSASSPLPSAVAEPKVAELAEVAQSSPLPSVVVEPKGAELAEMAHFFEKHRLTRERLEASSLLLLEKLKMLQNTPTPVHAAAAAATGEQNNPIDASEWEEYNISEPMFPFIALSKEARNLYLPRTIDVLKEPVTPLVFYREYVAQNIPVVIRGATKSWKSHLWTNSYLRRTMGDTVVSVEATPKGKGDFIRKGKFVMPEKRQMKLGEFLDVIETRSKAKGNLYISHQNGNFGTEFGPLHKDVEPHLAWASEAFGCLPEVTNIWMGDAKAFSSCHKDHYENIYVVVAGEKHFTLLPPTDYPWLYEQRFPPARFRQETSGKWRVYDEPNAAANKVPWIAVDPDAPDLTQFPLFSHCQPYKITVKAGECLYLPSMWYHQVSQTPDAEGRCIAVNYWYDMRYNQAFNYRNFLVNTTKRFFAEHKN